ncbi:MAG: DUF5398 family protein [Verrucomicrobia bacterium]|jgi:hypothetical protein|nr:DUF5398 family protein [Verrucomicrobiota bacterium]
MFGLDKGKKEPLFIFDLEKDLQDDSKQTKLVQRIEKHIQEIKTELRKGTKVEEFEKLGLLLHGYSALLKIITQPARKH